MKIDDRNPNATPSIEKLSVDRRDFLKVVGIVTVAAGGAALLGCDEGISPARNFSMGYILVDSRKCQGCLSCMVACSLVNEGCASLSLSRIQVMGNSFACYPDDSRTSQCRQCRDPKCVAYCANGALSIDTENGNIRRVNKNYCIGCGRCVQACPYEPKRPIVAPDEAFGGSLRARKCDLCLNASYHFSPNGGGIDGVRACEATCPFGAIQFTARMPAQVGDTGYDVNLRAQDRKYALLGYDTKL
jgi:Fe-S-cluster-containing dehydrogenase component